MPTSLGEMMIAAWQDGFRLAGGVPEHAWKFFQTSSTYGAIEEFPDMHRTEGGQWVWFIRSITVKDSDKRILPLDRDHYVMAVPHDWVKNEKDLEWLSNTVAKASIEMAGGKVTEISPTDRNFN